MIAFYFGNATINERPYGETLVGTFDSLKFYPVNRVSFTNVVFPTMFKCDGLWSAHSPARMTSCSDQTGLKYVFWDDDAKENAIVKGDLTYIEYGVDDAKKDEYTKP